ncbi:NAD(P)-binding protein [Pseudovirgaria hyperparasitica]|uniref:NAD(P)-binding protein n=1 Tax=Pseudovirgaria hyperparasitica TaxID=470096 RepID=A0A6A6W922_9PEZI|nr:NAD(P)-binding protein [Pseudovirgaria hyperparasitica]KAF2758430.1 NAD(P)-binding protein [Pseudovirgaria hyperparasitica]
MSSPFVAVAGSTGGLGQLIAQALRKRGVAVKGLVRPGINASRTEALRQAGVTIAPVDLSDQKALTKELNGATCVVSALQGLRDVIITTQGALLAAAVDAKVPRFIPSDYSLDFTKTKPGSNRNLDIHREFHSHLDKSGIAWTTILNGAFLDLMTSDMSPVNHKKRTVMYAGSADQPMDYTTMVDVAAYTAAAATDPNPTPKILRIAGAVASAKQMAAIVGEVEGVEYSPSSIGPVWLMERMIPVVRFFGGENDVFPAWQGMQYMANMASGAGKLDPLDNDRYSGLEWTSIAHVMREAKAKRP